MGTLEIFSIKSYPSTTLPKTGCADGVLRSNQFRKLLLFTLMKNCEPPEFGAPVFAMDKVPGSFPNCAVNSSSMLPPASRKAWQCCGSYGGWLVTCAWIGTKVGSQNSDDIHCIHIIHVVESCIYNAINGSVYIHMGSLLRTTSLTPSPSENHPGSQSFLQWDHRFQRGDFLGPWHTSSAALA